MSDLHGDEVHFEELATAGRVRCVETGHEMPAAEKDRYGRSKKCRRALFDFYLAQQKSPMNVFEQSPISRDKVVCKITGDTLNKTQEAVWKHMNGKKFQRKLAQKEAEKMMSVQHEELVLTDVSMQHGDTQKLKEQMDSAISPTEEDDCETQQMDFEGLEFWVPPEDDMEEFDRRHDERNFCDKQSCENEHSECINTEGSRSAYMNNDRIDEEEMATRTKRKPIEGPGRFALQKKSRKMKGSDAKLSLQ